MVSILPIKFHSIEHTEISYNYLPFIRQKIGKSVSTPQFYAGIYHRSYRCKNLQFSRKMVFSVTGPSLET